MTTYTHPNGRNLRLSPTGRYLAHGNWIVFVRDLVTGELHECGRGWSAGWLNDTTLGITDVLDPDDNRSRQWRAYRPDLRRWDPTTRVGQAPVACAGGVIWGRDNWTDSEDVRYERNGLPYPMDPALGRLAGDLLGNDGQLLVTPNQFLLLAQPDRGWRGVIVDAGGPIGRLVRELPDPINLAGRIYDGPDGPYVTYGRAGRTILNTPTGTHTLTAPWLDGNPWPESPAKDIGEAGAVIAWDDAGELWFFQIVWAGHLGQMFVAIRKARTSEMDGTIARVIELPHLGLDVHLDGGNLTLAGFAFGTPSLPDNLGRVITDIDIHAWPRTNVLNHVRRFDWPVTVPAKPIAFWPFGDPRGNVGGGQSTPDEDDCVIEGIGQYPDEHPEFGGKPWLAPENNTPERLLGYWTSRWDSEHALVQYPTDDAIRRLADGYLVDHVRDELVELYREATATGSRDFWPIERRIAEESSKRTGRPILVYNDHGWVIDTSVTPHHWLGIFDLLDVVEAYRLLGRPVVGVITMPPKGRQADASWETDVLVRPQIDVLTAIGVPVMLNITPHDGLGVWQPLHQIARKLNHAMALSSYPNVIGYSVVGLDGRRTRDPEFSTWVDQRWLPAIDATLRSVNRSDFPSVAPILPDPRVPGDKPDLPVPPKPLPPPTRDEAIAISQIAAILVGAGLGTVAIARAIRAVRSDRSLLADLDWIRRDATARRRLSRLAAGLEE